MDYSIGGNETEEVWFDVQSLYSCFSRLTDRRQRRGRRYELAFVLSMVVLAKLAGEDKPEGISEWVRARKALWVKPFGLQRLSMPSANTYRRVLSDAIVETEFEQHLAAFWKRQLEVGEQVQVALDGKFLRGTMAWGDRQGLQLLAAYLPQAGVVLFQAKVERGTNEILAAPQVIKTLDLQGKIVTGDALYAQRELSQQVVQAGGDYLWMVKDNQPRLRQDIEQLFQPEIYVKGFGPTSNDFRQTQTLGKGHGRIELRRLTTSSLLAETSDWPGLAQVFKLERRTTLVARSQVRQESVYGVTSLTAADAGPKRLLELVRSHWAIENGLHYRRDKTLKEDEGRMTNWALAHTLATLNNLVISLLLYTGQVNLPKMRRFFAAHPDQALNLLLKPLA